MFQPQLGPDTDAVWTLLIFYIFNALVERNRFPNAIG
jgi:hypothetical protein